MMLVFCSMFITAHHYLSIHTNALRVLDIWCVTLPYLLWFRCACACAYPITQSLCCTPIWASPVTRARRHDTLRLRVNDVSDTRCKPNKSRSRGLAPVVAVPTSLAPATTQSPGGDPDPNPQVVEAPSYTSISSVCVILFNRSWDIS